MSKTDRDRPRLGRGLSTLLSSEQRREVGPKPILEVPSSPPPSAPVTAGGAVIDLPLSSISANPSQPRRRFEISKLNELADSLKGTGLIQPVIVRQLNGSYQLIAGERRWRAAEIAGLTTIPAIVREVDGAAQAEMALVENIQREDLNPIERAEAYRKMIEQLGLTQNELADKLGDDRSTIANHLRLLTLAPEVREQIADRTLSLGHAKVLAGLEDPALQAKLAQRAIVEDWSVRQLEAAIKQGGQAAEPKKAKPPSAHLLEMEKTIARQIGMRVQVRSSGKTKGRLVIHYGSLDQFDELVAKLGVRLDTE